MLKTIWCNCEKVCSNNKCGCRKHGLCSNGQGLDNCTNIEKKSHEEFSDSEDIEEDELRNIHHEDDGNDHNSELQDLDDLEETESFTESDEEVQAKRKILLDN